MWQTQEPRFEGISMHEAGADVGPLSALPALLDASSESRPRGNVSIAPNDIVITPVGDAAGSTTITLRNQGDVALHRVFVDVAVAQNPTDRGTQSPAWFMTSAHGATDITLPSAYFPGGFCGVVLVLAMQLAQHRTFPDWSSYDPTPEDAVAFRVFNVPGAPPNYVNTIREGCGSAAGKAPNQTLHLRTV